MEYIELLCKSEARNDKKEKVMQFTEGKNYNALKLGIDHFEVEDDNGNSETFFDIGFMFSIVVPSTCPR